MRIDELRKRLLEERARITGDVTRIGSLTPRTDLEELKPRPHVVEQTQNREPATPLEPRAAEAATADLMFDLNQTSVSNAIAKSFERTKAFEDRFAKLMSTFEQADRLAQQAIEAVEQLGELADHLPSLVKAFEPMKAVKRQLAALANVFEPMKPAEEQIAEFSSAFSRAFHENLVRIARMLEPVRDFQGRLAQLASDFSPANDLQRRFNELALAFQESPAEEPEPKAKAESSEQASAEDTIGGQIIPAEGAPALNGTSNP
jgi:DNA repair exonuclease SbcCD ATPase subunit